MFTGRGDQQPVTSEPMVCVCTRACVYARVGECVWRAGPECRASSGSRAPGGAAGGGDQFLRPWRCRLQHCRGSPEREPGANPRAAGPPAVCSGGHGVLGGVGRRAGLGVGSPRSRPQARGQASQEDGWAFRAVGGGARAARVVSPSEGFTRMCPAESKNQA